MGSHVVAAGYCSFKNLTLPNDLNWGFLVLILSQNDARSSVNIDGKSRGYVQQVTVCQVSPGQFKDYLSILRCQIGSKKGLSKSRLFNFWQYYTHALLVYWSSYWMMLKSASSNYVHTRPLLVNLLRTFSYQKIYNDCFIRGTDLLLLKHIG